MNISLEEFSEKILDEIAEYAAWNGEAYYRGYVDGLARALQIMHADTRRNAQNQK